MSLTGDIAVAAASDSFWEVNGHQRVVKRAENGSQMCNELAKMLIERAEIERDYAKRLKAWSGKWTESLETGSEYGTNKAALCCLSFEADQLADVHLAVRDRITNEVVPKIKDWKSENYKKQLMGGCKEAKTFDEEFHRVQKPWAKRLARVVKSKRDYHTACRVERTAINQENNAKNSTDISQDQIKKFQEKVEKCQREVELSRECYKSALNDLNLYNAKYVEEMTEVFSKTQDFETRRLSFIKKLLFEVHSTLDLSHSSQIIDIYSELHKIIDRCDVNSDIKWWADTYGVGMAMAWPVYEEYVGEFHSISRKERDLQMAHVGGTGDGIKLTLIQRSDTDSTLNAGGGGTGQSSANRARSVDEWNDCDPPGGSGNGSNGTSTKASLPKPYGANGSSIPLAGPAMQSGSTATGAGTEAKNNGEGVMVLALYDYVAQESDELSFKAGDKFLKMRDRDDLGWCTGNIQGKIGLFPDNYVRELPR